MMWQPIDTAPKDGTWILGFRPHPSLPDQIECWAWNAFDFSGDLWINASDDNDADEQPTHWMPLPEPPQ